MPPPRLLLPPHLESVNRHTPGWIAVHVTSGDGISIPIPIPYPQKILWVWDHRIPTPTEPQNSTYSYTHRIPMGLWGWKIIPIPTPYPYLWGSPGGSPYPRQRWWRHTVVNIAPLDSFHTEHLVAAARIARINPASSSVNKTISAISNQIFYSSPSSSGYTISVCNQPTTAWRSG